jgi:hypothetical protein
MSWLFAPVAGRISESSAARRPELYRPLAALDAARENRQLVGRLGSLQWAQA